MINLKPFAIIGFCYQNIDLLINNTVLIYCIDYMNGFTSYERFGVFLTQVCF